MSSTSFVWILHSTRLVRPGFPWTPGNSWKNSCSLLCWPWVREGANTSMLGNASGVGKESISPYITPRSLCHSPVLMSLPHQHNPKPKKLSMHLCKSLVLLFLVLRFLCVLSGSWSLVHMQFQISGSHSLVPAGPRSSGLLDFIPIFKPLQLTLLSVSIYLTLNTAVVICRNRKSGYNVPVSYKNRQAKQVKKLSLNDRRNSSWV